MDPFFVTLVGVVLFVVALAATVFLIGLFQVIRLVWTFLVECYGHDRNEVLDDRDSRWIRWRTY